MLCVGSGKKDLDSLEHLAVFLPSVDVKLSWHIVISETAVLRDARLQGAVVGMLLVLAGKA